MSKKSNSKAKCKWFKDDIDHWDGSCRNPRILAFYGQKEHDRWNPIKCPKPDNPHPAAKSKCVNMEVYGDK